MLISYGNCLACGSWHSVETYQQGDTQFFICPVVESTLVIEGGKIRLDFLTGPEVDEAIKQTRSKKEGQR